MKHLSASIKVGIMVLLLVIGSYTVWKSIGANPAGANNYILWARFQDASGMPVGSRVVVAGLPVGEISKLSIDGRYAKVTFRIRDEIKVWSSGVVFKKSTSLLGDYYLEIDPGNEQTTTPDGELESHTLLNDGDQVPRVVESTSPDQLMRRIEDSLPHVDAVLLSVRDLSDDMRRLVNGPIASIANRVDDLVKRESETVSAILAKADRSMERIDLITQDIRSITKGADSRIDAILANLDEASAEARALMASAKSEVESTGAVVREKLELVDEVLERSESIARKIDDDKGTLGRLVNDPAIADNVEDITDDAKGFLGTLFNIQAFVGLRTEYNVFAGLTRHYVSVELHTRPDKFYLIELEKGPRGDYPTVTLEYDPLIDPNAWIRRATIEDKIRFTFQFAKRLGWATFRYGLKESTGGVGFDAQGSAFGRSLKVSADLFDATFDQMPRLKIAASLELFRYIYVLGGVDELLNPSDSLTINSGTMNVPIQFEEFHFGRDFFLGAMLRFNDEDLTSLLTVGGSALSGAAR